MHPSDLEQIDPQVVFAMTHSVREKTWQAVHAIKELIRPGISEKEAIKIANEYLADQGVKKFWHRTHIRFGASTVLSFQDPYQDHVVLKENDIFYIDIGPVWDGIEGDCGDTFVLGEKPQFLKIKNDVRTLFETVKSFWKEDSSQNKALGSELYLFTKTEVEKAGYLLYPSYVKGHRLSEFSHAKYTTVGLADWAQVPQPERWVLEFQICDPSLQFGAFYEDLLI